MHNNNIKYLMFVLDGTVTLDGGYGVHGFLLIFHRQHLHTHLLSLSAHVSMDGLWWMFLLPLQTVHVGHHLG